MTIKSSRHGGDVFGLSEEERQKTIDFSININPLGLSPMGKKALCCAWEIETLRYPDVECRELRHQLSIRYGMAEETIALGNGATELMYKMLELLRPQKVIVTAPAFSEYRLSAEAAHVLVESVVLHKENNFHLPIETIKEKMTKHTLVYLGNPNNPDGQLLPKEDFLSLLKRAKETGSFLFIDESFIDFVGEDASYRSYFKDNDCGAVVMSLTKFYAVPGLRIGCAFMSPFLCERLKDTLIPWNVNGLAQCYMTAALQDSAYREETVLYCKKERRALVEALEKLPYVEVLPGCVNFILCRLIDRFVNAAALQEALRPFHIFIRQCGNYEGLDNTYFRVAVRTEEENRKLLDALENLVPRD